MRKLRFCEYKFRSTLFSGTLTKAVSYVLLLCDSIIAGYFIGENGVAAINTIAPVTAGVIFFSNIISIGTGILYSRRIGAMQKKEADEIFGQGVILSVLIAAGGVLILCLCRNAYFDAAGITGEVYELAAAYYRWTPLSVVFEVLIAYLMQMVYIDGDELCNNISNAAMIVGNLVFSILLVGKYGMEGIILGTIIGNAIGVLPGFWHFFRKNNTLHFAFHFSFSELLQTVRYSLVDSVIFLCWAVADYVMIGHVSVRYGEVGLVALAIAFNLIEFGVVLDGVGSAIQPLIGTYFGEDNTLMIRRLMKDAFTAALLEGLIVSALAFIFAGQFCMLFGITGGPALSLSVRTVRIMAPGLTFCSILSLVTSYYMLIDHVTLSVVITALNNGVFYSFLPIAGSIMYGMNGMWAAFTLSPLLTLFIAAVIVWCLYGKLRFPLLLKDNDSEIYVMDDILTKENISRMSENVSDLLLKRDYPKKTALKAALFTEEICLTILEKNSTRKNTLFAEMTLFFDKSSVLLIERDSGMLFDLTDPDLKLDGISGFILSGLMEAHGEKAYLTTTGYNRNMIRFRKEAL
ncbi:MAG: hypothetical protein IJU87_03270 [Lachnospiraceae bacterium]|nr:hypothetical protein [Lachnospiraceae bacterium]